ncbi:MAG: hypothetical protein M1831_006433 [Alyxoria varia]|nr:MAG: hypothetical protein M1831_006433 [Alyxoria varia]
MAVAPGSYLCDIDAEPLERYRPGGYHPVHIGDKFKNGRYRVAHKLGWGGYSTVWLAHDAETSRLVALKFLVAETSTITQESSILRQISTETHQHRGKEHLGKLLDQFDFDGPNGTHKCLSLEVEGPSVQALVQRYPLQRLPGALAWTISKQICLALDFLHSVSICFGDLHSGNIMVSPGQDGFRDPTVLDSFPRPSKSDIQALPGVQLSKSLPLYLVDSVCLPQLQSTRPHVKLCDFGEAFQFRNPPKDVRTPLIFRAPEVLLGSTCDSRMDIWALACTFFELVTGQPPFDNLMPDKSRLIQEWMATFGDLPAEWGARANVEKSNDMETLSITDWLRDCYFNNEEQRTDFAEEHLEWLGDLLGKMMRYKPEDRLPTREILQHRWFAREPFELEQT